MRKKSLTWVDLMAGEVSDRLLAALNTCTYEELENLYQKGSLRRRKDGLLMHDCLLIENLSQYAKVAKCRIHDFFFPEDYVPTYTEQDALVIQMLDLLSDKEQTTLLSFFREHYWNPSLDIGADLRPSGKLVSRLSSLPYGSMVRKDGKLNTPAYKCYRMDIMPVLELFRKRHYSTRSLFHSDYLADLSTFVGVSLHWICSMDGPLFCKSQNGDLLFDHYTLATPAEQAEMFRFLKMLIREKYEVMESLIGRIGLYDVE